MLRSQIWLVLFGLCSVSFVVPARAEMGELGSGRVDECMSGCVKSPSTHLPIHPVTRLRDLKQRPATTLKEWIAQIEAATVQVTGVKLERTATGLDIILETAEGKLLQVDATKFRSEGNSLIADIPNAVLTLPDAQTFTAENPTADIATVQVEQRAGNIRVSVTGTNALPTTEVALKTGELAYSLNPEGEEPDEEIVVTGEREGDRVPNTSVGTRTDTPLRDIPASIQIVPKQVLEEQRPRTLGEALRNAPGVIQTAPDNLPAFQDYTIRGFTTGRESFTRNGLSYYFGGAGSAIFSNIERIEVLKGNLLRCCSVRLLLVESLTLSPNQPLRELAYSVEVSAGSYNFYQGAIDLTEPLNDSRTILYRLNASYESGGSFVDFQQREVPAVAGALKFELGDRTDLTFNVEYSRLTQGWHPGLPAVGTIFPNPNGEIPRNRNIATGDGDYSPEVFRVGYDLEHRLSENWSLRNSFFFAHSYTRNRNLYGAISLDPDLRTVQRILDDGDYYEQTFELVTNVVGRFSTGAIQHQLLLGADLRRLQQDGFFYGAFFAAPLDLFNPVYSSERFGLEFAPFKRNELTDSVGIYVQDQVTLTDNLKLLLGGRFDAFEQTNRNLTERYGDIPIGKCLQPPFGHCLSTD